MEGVARKCQAETRGAGFGFVILWTEVSQRIAVASSIHLGCDERWDILGVSKAI
jgi:hypothetical protein